MANLQKTYIICATQRSGSTLLCRFLENSGLAGHPSEFLLPSDDAEAEFDRNFPASGYDDYIKAQMVQFASNNGVSGVKIMNNTWQTMMARLQLLPKYAGCSEPAIITSLFPQVSFLFITRQNKIRQAISLSRAEQSAVWEKHSATKASENAQTHPQGKDLHPFYVKSALKRVNIREQFWADFFHKNSIQPMEIAYEDLTENYQEIVPQVLDFIGISYPKTLQITQNKLKKQSDFYTEFLIFYYHTYFLFYRYLPKPLFNRLRWLKNRLVTP
ncbi:MAG: Stf0 family sulfotransferase [Phormidesmis sp.]